MRSPTRVLALSLLLGSIVLVACSTRGSNEAALAGAVPVPSVSPSMGLCRPAAGGPYWLTETETVSFTAACATGNTAATLTIANLPAGASFDGHAFSFTPGLDQAAVYHLQL